CCAELRHARLRLLAALRVFVTKGGRLLRLDVRLNAIVAKRARRGQRERPLGAAPVANLDRPFVDLVVSRIEERHSDRRRGGKHLAAASGVAPEHRLEVHLFAQSIDAAIGEHRSAQMCPSVAAPATSYLKLPP